MIKAVARYDSTCLYENKVIFFPLEWLYRWIRLCVVSMIFHQKLLKPFKRFFLLKTQQEQVYCRGHGGTVGLVFQSLCLTNCYTELDLKTDCTVTEKLEMQSTKFYLVTVDQYSSSAFLFLTCHHVPWLNNPFPSCRGREYKKSSFMSTWITANSFPVCS